jgi:hypothetical protein
MDHHVHTSFQPKEVKDFATASRSGTDRSALSSWGMHRKAFPFSPPRSCSSEPSFNAHTGEILERALEGCRETEVREL